MNDKDNSAHVEGSDIKSEERGWISVKDRLPKKDGYYLVNLIYSSEVYQAVIYFYVHAQSDESNWQDHGFSKYPTHWMPLPEPPLND